MSHHDTVPSAPRTAGSRGPVLPFAVVAPSTAGSFLARKRPPVVHVRACAPARQGGRAGACAGVVGEVGRWLRCRCCQGWAVAVRRSRGRDRLSAATSASLETLARVRRLAGRDGDGARRRGFFSYDMIAGSRSQNAKVKAAIEATGDDAWQAIAYTRGGVGPEMRPPSSPAAAATSSAAATPSPPSCAWSYAAAAARRPGRAVAQLALPLLRHRPTRPRHRRRRPATPQSSSPSSKAPGSAAAPQDPRQRRLNDPLDRPGRSPS